MANTTKEILHIAGPLASLGNAQMGFELVNDTALGFPMWGGKDAQGNITKFLAKGKPGQLQTIQLTGTSTVGKVGFLKHDASGNVTGGHESSVIGGGGNRNFGEWTLITSGLPTEGQLYYGYGNGVITLKISKLNGAGEKIELLKALRSGAVASCWSSNDESMYFSYTPALEILDQGDYWQFSGYLLSNFGALTAGNKVSFDFKNSATVSSEAQEITFTVRNLTGVTLTALRPVQIGADIDNDGIPEIFYCQANIKASCTNVVVLLEDIGIGQTGKAIRAGLHTGINTSGLVSGATYYVSATGASIATATEPAYPYLSCKLFKCLDSHATLGSIDVVIDSDPQYQTGTVASTQQIETFSIALAGAEINPTINGYTFYASMVLPALNMTVNTASRLTTYVRQYAAGNLSLAVYKLESNGDLTRLFFTPMAAVAPSFTGFLKANIGTIDAQFSADDILYFGIFANTNGIRFAGNTGVAFNTAPYATLISDNRAETSPPATILSSTYQSAANAIYAELNLN